MPLDWNSFEEGDSIPELKKAPGVTQLVKYSAGGGDFNPLHHDFNFPQSKMIGSIIIHGRFNSLSPSRTSGPRGCISLGRAAQLSRGRGKSLLGSRQ